MAGFDGLTNGDRADGRDSERQDEGMGLSEAPPAASPDVQSPGDPTKPPKQAPNVELALAKMANDAMQAGADPHEATAKLHGLISYLRRYPAMAEHANNALRDGVVTPADISVKLWPHVQADSHSTGSNEPTAQETASFGGEDSMPAAAGHALVTTTLNAAQGIPGVRALEAGMGALGSHATDHPMSYRESLKTLDDDTDKLGTGLKVAGRVVGGFAAGTAVPLPSNAVTAGATMGAADGALDADPNKSLMDRLWDATTRGAAGAAGGAIMKGAGNIAQRVGTTDFAGKMAGKVADAIPKVSTAPASNTGVLATARNMISDQARRSIGPTVNAVKSGLGDMSEAAGTKGAANRLINQRQDILNDLDGSEHTAAKTMLDHVENLKTKADQLYTVAKQDKGVIADPRVRQSVDDPEVRQALDITRSRFNLGPNPTTVNVNSPLARPVVAGHVGSAPPQINVTPGSPPPSRLVNQFGRSLVPASPPNVSVTVDLPTPEELALTKRMLSDVVSGRYNGSGLDPALAAKLAPKVDMLRSALHDASPAWKEADGFYSKAKDFQTAYGKAFGLSQNQTAAGLDPKKLNSAEALSAWAARKAGTPEGLARQSGVQAGAAGKLAEKLKGAPLGTDIGKTLDNAGGLFEPSQSAANVRRLAFGKDQAGAETDAPAFTTKLGKAYAEALEQRAGSGGGLIERTVRTITQPPNLLAKPAGVKVRYDLSGKLADPAKGSEVVRDAGRAVPGGKLLDQLRNAVMGGANGPVANRASSSGPSSGRVP